jgi:hypothetical protein
MIINYFDYNETAIGNIFVPQQTDKTDINKNIHLPGPVQFSLFSRGGHRTLKSINDLERLHYSFKELGMTVYIEDEEKYYLLLKLGNFEQEDDGWGTITTTYYQENEIWIEFSLKGGHLTVEDITKNYPNGGLDPNVAQIGMTIYDEKTGTLQLLKSFSIDSETGKATYIWEELPRKNDIPIIPEQNYIIVSTSSDLPYQENSDKQNGHGVLAFVKENETLYIRKYTDVLNKSAGLEWQELKIDNEISLSVENYEISDSEFYPAILVNKEPIVLFDGHTDSENKKQIELSLDELEHNSKTYVKLNIKISDEFILHEGNH